MSSSHMPNLIHVQIFFRCTKSLQGIFQVGSEAFRMQSKFHCKVHMTMV